MLIFKIVVLVLCAVIACCSVKKIVETAVNLRAIRRGRKYPYDRLQSAGMVYNTKTGKLESDNRQILPFD